ncbi:Uncharacterized protein GBIM_16710 [Gryllus bimaculatus]|nr:Uncharacterized protein GBIM_16710 [Gryllus bimaculatus]
MSRLLFVTSYILFISFQCATSKFDHVHKSLEDLDITYPKNVYNERGLRECQLNAACSILHRRFWFKLRVERICQCSAFQECPTRWSYDGLDNFTMMINNRAQMKFCHPVNELPECEPSEEALIITSNTTVNPDKYNKSQSVEVTHQQATTNCKCQFPHYWRLHNVTQVNKNISISIYMCDEYKKCRANEFCGHIRADYFSTYYRCSCPIGYLCLFEDLENRKLLNATEVLFEGLAYRGACKFNRAKPMLERTSQT